MERLESVQVVRKSAALLFMSGLWPVQNNLPSLVENLELDDGELDPDGIA